MITLEFLRAWRSIEITGGLTDWNDVPNRTQAEVLALLDSAILSLRVPRICNAHNQA
jgi:hypothetical protein